MTLGVLCLTAAAAWAPQRAQADGWDIEGFSIGGRGDYLNPKDGPANWYGGAQLRLQGEVFGLEGSIDDRHTNSNGQNVNTYPVQASVLARLMPGSRITPFILGGAGWYNTERSGTDAYGNHYDNTSSLFGLHAGIGLECFLSRYWSIDGTYRYLWIETQKTKDNDVQNRTYDQSGSMITVALNYHF